MVPKASQRSTMGNPQDIKVKSALKKLCESITGEKKKNGETIKATATVTVLKEALRNCRNHGTIFDASYITRLASILEDDHGDICSSIEPPLFGVIVEAMFQVDHCLEAERVLYLLADSLVRGTNEANGEIALAEISGRKSAIGKACLVPVLDYFLNTDNDDRLRRWVGTLLIQLIRQCDKNVEKLEFSSEDLRRSIGRVTLEEPNEIIRLICGELIRTLHEERVDLQTLWPLGTQKLVYEQFPPPSQTGHGWGQEFQDYIDNLFDEKEARGQAIGDLIPITSMSLEPPHAFGVPNQNMVTFLTEVNMTIRAPSLAITTGQILDIPVASIKQVIITSQDLSQSTLANIAFELAPSDEMEFNLDGTIIELQKVIGSIKLTQLEPFKEALRDCCPDTVIVEVDDSRAGLPTSSDGQNNASQKSGVAEILGNPRRISLRGSEEPNSIPTRSTLKKPNGNMAITDVNEDFDELVNSLAMETTQDVAEPVANAFDELKNAPTLEEEEQSPGEAPVSEQTETQLRCRNKVKPKAKPPIVPPNRQNNVKALPSQQLKQTPQVSTKADTKDQPGGSQLQSGKDSSSSQSKRKAQTNTASSTNTASQLKKGPKTSTGPSTTKKGDINKNANRSSLTHSTSSSTKGKDKVSSIDSDEITTPEPNNASTPKPMLPPAKSNNLRTSTTSQDIKDVPQNSGKKRYSLHGLESTRNQQSVSSDNVFDMPGDGEDGSGGDSMAGNKKKNFKGKQPAKNTGTAAKVRKTAVSKAKPARKSAPAALQQSQAPTRHSQRAAAKKANSMLHETSDNDEDAEEAVEENSKPGPSQKAKVKPLDDTQKSQTAQTVSKKPLDVKPKPSPKQHAKGQIGVKPTRPKDTTAQLEATSTDFDNQDPDLEDQADMASQDHLEPMNVIGDEDDIYGATPLKSQSKVKDAIAPAESTAAGAIAAPSKRPPRDSGIDMASKLDNIFEELDDGVLDTGSDTANANVVMKPSVKEMFVPAGEVPEANVKKFGADQNIKAVEQVTEEPAAENDDLDHPSMDEPAVSPPATATPTPMIPQPKSSKPFESSTSQGQQKQKDEARNEASDMQGETTSRNKPKETATEATIKDDIVRAEANGTTDKEALAAKISTSEKSANVKTKRKAKGDDEAVQPKRRKSDEVSQVQEPEKGQLPKKPRMQSKQPSPIRRSPRLEKAEKVAADDAKGSSAVKCLVDDQAHRKPTLISFGTQGPRNQGRVSPLKNLIEEPKGKIQPAELTPQPVRTDSGRKRKQDQETFADDASPPSKRRETSPLHYNDDNINAIGDDDQSEEVELSPEASQAEEVEPLRVEQGKEVKYVALQSTPAPLPESPSMHSRPKVASRLSSRSSKVNFNGSPSNPAHAQVDYIGKLKKRLSRDHIVEEPVEKNQEVVKEVAVGLSRERRISEVFGPKVPLSSRLKALPSSPEEVTTRYIAHEKSEQGHYTGVTSKEVIAQEKVLPNPFAENSRRTSTFTNRLLASASKEVRKPSDEVVRERPRGNRVKALQQPELPKLLRDEVVEERPRAVRVQAQEQHELPKLPRGEISKVHFNHDKDSRRERKRRQSVFDDEETLVEPKHCHINNLSEPDDMTNGSSIQSETSDSSREPLSERPTPNTEWNMVLRPHYRTLNDAVHRIADEVIIRLSDEEDRMGLMVEQYRENGSRIVDKLLKKRTEERNTILKNLEGKKEEMMSVYTEAKDFIQQTTEELKESQVTRFEKAWRKQQDEVRKQIAEGRKVSE